MKKSLTLAFVLAALAVFAGPGHAQQRVTPNSPPTRVKTKPPVPQGAATFGLPINNASERVATSPKVMTGKVAQVNLNEKTFAIDISFSAAKLGDLPKIGEIIETAYTKAPDGSLEATTVKSAKSNGSDRTARNIAPCQECVTGKVMRVNEKGKAFAIEVDFSAAKLTKLPGVGEIVDVTFTEAPGGGLIAETANLDLSKSNIN